MGVRCAATRKKTPVIGIVERSRKRGIGRVKALATPDVTAERVLGIVHEHVLPKSTVFTDEYRIYDRVGGTGERTSSASITPPRSTSLATFTRTRLKAFGR